MRRTVAIDAATTKADWETPPAVFEKLNMDFGPFDIDLTANSANYLCPTFLGPGSTIGEDALCVNWAEHGRRGYSNPPYGPFVQQLLVKAERQRWQGVSSTLLLPMRVTKAFLCVVVPMASTVYFCDRRICFYENGHPRWNRKALAEKGEHRPDPAMFDSIIVRFNPGIRGHIWDVWEVPPHV